MIQTTSKDLNKTLYVTKDHIENNRKWYIIDASWKTLWRLAVLISKILLWKNKSYYNDFWDCWDFVIVENCKDIKVTWNKFLDKLYHTYSWFKWNVKTKTYKDVVEKDPTKVLHLAIRWMLSKNKLRDKRLKRLKLYKSNCTKYNNLNLIKI